MNKLWLVGALLVGVIMTLPGKANDINIAAGELVAAPGAGEMRGDDEAGFCGRRSIDACLSGDEAADGAPVVVVAETGDMNADDEAGFCGRRSIDACASGDEAAADGEPVVVLVETGDSNADDEAGFCGRRSFDACMLVAAKLNLFSQEPAGRPRQFW